MENREEEPSGVLVLERRKPVPESMLWNKQREYFDSLPMKSNTNTSTHLSISCNSYVAKVLFSIVCDRRHTPT